MFYKKADINLMVKNVIKNKNQIMVSVNMSVICVKKTNKISPV